MNGDAEPRDPSMAHSPSPTSSTSRPVVLIPGALLFFLCILIIARHAGPFLAPMIGSPVGEGDRFVEGMVRDGKGEPLQGATVRFKGTADSVQSDAAGRFHLPGRGDRVTATLEGFFIAGVPATETPLTITLKRLPADDHEDYAWVRPYADPHNKQNCGNCHEAIVQEWNASAHAGVGKRFRAIYKDLLNQYPEGSGVCTSCHAPTVPAGDEASFDLTKVSDRGLGSAGVHCDYCHKITEAGRGRLGHTHGRDGIRLRRPAQGQLFFGPLDDVDRGEDAFLPLYKKSQYCASCHEGTVFGVHVYSTYSEWLESPARRQGKQCQTCHMTPTGKMTNIAPDQGGVDRDSATLASHHFPGSTAEMLRGCLKLSLTAAPGPDHVNVVAELVADNVGHRVPTGFIDRSLVLLVEPAEAGMVKSGPVLPAIAGFTIADGKKGESLADKPGRLYAKLLPAADKKQVQPFWKADDPDAVDTRLIPGQADRSEFHFTQQTSRLRVRLIHRRFWPDTALQKQWADNDLVLVDTLIALDPARVVRWANFAR